MICLLHRYIDDHFDGPHDVGEGFARTFGNGFLIKKCRKCGKEKRKPMHLPA